MKFALVLVLLLATVATLTAAEKPSFLIIVSEDQGYEDVGFHTGKVAVTPHLDKPMVSGARRTNHCTIERNHNHEP